MKWIAAVSLVGFSGLVNAQPVVVSADAGAAKVQGDGQIQRIAKRDGGWQATGEKSQPARLTISSLEAASLAAAVAPGLSMKGVPRAGGGWTLYPAGGAEGGRMEITPAGDGWRVFFGGRIYRASPRAGSGWSVVRVGG